jgi:hypothetical protein
MLRITVLSLLLGAAVLIVGLTQFFPASSSYRQEAPALVWNASTAKVTSGTRTIIDTALQLELDSAGAGVVSLAAGNIKSKDFSFIHLALEEPAKNLVAAIVWTNAQKPQESHSYTIENHTRQSLWLATEELRGWNGEIGTLSLSFLGRAGDIILIKDFSAFPASATHELLAIYTDLTGYAPWNSAAMNTYTGAFNSSSFYPIALAVAFLVLCLLAYGLLLFIFRAKLRFNPAVVALIFLANWVILDMLWQYRLLHQLADTHSLFSGKNTEERLAAGPDAKLYNLVSNVKPLLDSVDSRIFVTSSDNYSGMRSAYYFYPLNAYWSLYGASLPRKKSLRRGDYLVLIQPSEFEFDPIRSRVVAPKRRHLNAELVFSDPSGTVVRLK